MGIDVRDRIAVNVNFFGGRNHEDLNCKTIAEAEAALDRYSRLPGFRWGRIVTARSRYAETAWWAMARERSTLIHRTIGICPPLGVSGDPTTDRSVPAADYPEAPVHPYE